MDRIFQVVYYKLVYQNNRFTECYHRSYKKIKVTGLAFFSLLLINCLSCQRVSNTSREQNRFQLVSGFTTISGLVNYILQPSSIYLLYPQTIDCRLQNRPTVGNWRTAVQVRTCLLYTSRCV